MEGEKKGGKKAKCAWPCNVMHRSHPGFQLYAYKEGKRAHLAIHQFEPFPDILALAVGPRHQHVNDGCLIRAWECGRSVCEFGGHPEWSHPSPYTLPLLLHPPSPFMAFLSTVASVSGSWVAGALMVPCPNSSFTDMDAICEVTCDESCVQW